MKRLLVLMLFFAMGGVAAADEPASDEESAKVAEALKGWGCEGGDLVKEGSRFEVDDATCSQGEYDFYLDKDFTVFALVKCESP